MKLALENQFLGLESKTCQLQPLRFRATRWLVFASFLAGWMGGESNLAFAQFGFSHDPVCGTAYRLGFPSSRSASRQEAVVLAANGSLNKALEYEVKAALVYRCLEHALWPAGSDASRQTTTIGLLGGNPVRDSFERLAGKTVAGRKLVVKNLSVVRKASSCQVVFVSASEQLRTPQFLQQLADLPILTVGETPEFTQQGGMISLLTEGKHIRLEVNLAAAAKAGITLDAALQLPSPGAGTNQVYHTRGLIREIAATGQKAVIRHEAIPNYMPAMTMEFNVRDARELGGMAVGDTVAFRLTTTEDTHWIDNLHVVAATANTSPLTAPAISPDQSGELKVGDLLPDYELIAEDGRRVRFSDFRGKALAFTFIFTRCPLPDFCPRMGNNFARTRELIRANRQAPANWQFLSLSFDPEFDQPAVLSRYAESYRKGDADRWLFAAAPKQTLAELAPRLDLMVNRDSGSGLSHNLRTVVVDPQGRIHRQFNGNEWTPQQLAESLLEAAGTGNQVAPAKGR